MDRHFTSVFSDYEPMENSSLNSKQLEYWLKQISGAPIAHKPAHQWTLTNNQSAAHQTSQASSLHFAKHDTDAISFGKFTSSVDKQNDSSNSNAMGPTARTQAQYTSKSYISAMKALQNKVKTLENQNSLMRRSLEQSSKQRFRSMSSSLANEEELKSRIKILEPKLSKLDELIEQNKTLREAREQKNRKCRLLEKTNQELLKKLQVYMQQRQGLLSEMEKLKPRLLSCEQALTERQAEIRQLLEKNKQLEQMKEKSTLSLFQKYNRSLELAEQLEKEKSRLKNQVECLNKRLSQSTRDLRDSHEMKVSKMTNEVDKLRQMVESRDEALVENRKQIQYLREALVKKETQFAQLLRIHKNFLENRHQKQASLKELHQAEKNCQQEIQSKESSIIDLPHTLIPAQDKKQGYANFYSDNDELEQSEIPNVIETKSVGKHRSTRTNQVAKGQQKQTRRTQMKEKKQIAPAALFSPLPPIKKQVKKKNSKDVSDSMQPCNQGPNKATMQELLPQHSQTPDSRIYSAQSRSKNNQHASLAVPQQPKEFSCRNNQSQDLDELMLVQLQKELLELYEEQERLVIASNSEFSTQAQRLEFLGTLKHINDQLEAKNHRVCELKAKFVIGSSRG